MTVMKFRQVVEMLQTQQLEIRKWRIQVRRVLRVDVTVVGILCAQDQVTSLPSQQELSLLD